MMVVKLTSETSCVLFKDQRVDNVQRKIRKIRPSIVSMFCCFMSRYLMLHVSAFSTELSSGCMNS